MGDFKVSAHLSPSELHARARDGLQSGQCSTPGLDYHQLDQDGRVDQSDGADATERPLAGLLAQRLEGTADQEAPGEEPFDEGMRNNAMEYQEYLNGRRTLKFKQFCELIRQRELGTHSKEELQQRWHSIDTDRDGRISTREYLVWSLRDALARSAGRVLTIFRAWDEDGSGTVSRREFRKAIRGLGFDFCGDEGAVDEVFDEMDGDGNGTLSFKEVHSKLRSGMAMGMALEEDMLTGGGHGAAAQRSVNRHELRRVPAAQRGSSLANAISAVDVANKPIAEQLREALAINYVRVFDLFRSWDENGDGMISRAEFRKAMRVMGCKAPPEHVNELFALIDRDSSGEISFEELNKTLRRTDGGAGGDDAGPRAWQPAYLPRDHGRSHRPPKLPPWRGTVLLPCAPAEVMPTGAGLTPRSFLRASNRFGVQRKMGDVFRPFTARPIMATDGPFTSRPVTTDAARPHFEPLPASTPRASRTRDQSTRHAGGDAASMRVSPRAAPMPTLLSPRPTPTSPPRAHSAAARSATEIAISESEAVGCSAGCSACSRLPSSRRTPRSARRPTPDPPFGYIPPIRRNKWLEKVALGGVTDRRPAPVPAAPYVSPSPRASKKATQAMQAEAHIFWKG